MIARFLALACLLAAPAWAQEGEPADKVAAAARSIRSKSLIGPDDVVMIAASPATIGAITDVNEIIGKEARVALYPGRPIRRSDLADPAMVERNDIVRLTYTRGALVIAADGRALERGGVNQRIRAMNLDSRITIVGTVVGPGEVEVGR